MQLLQGFLQQSIEVFIDKNLGILYEIKDLVDSNSFVSNLLIFNKNIVFIWRCFIDTASNV